MHNGSMGDPQPPAAGVGPVHLVVGQEELLVERAVQRVVDTARAADPQTEVRRIRAPELEPGDLAELVSPSLFTQARVVVLQAAQDGTKDIAAAIQDYASDVPDGIVLVVTHSGGGRSTGLVDRLRGLDAAVTECPKITRSGDRAAFVRDEVRRAGGSITPDAVTALIDAVGTDLRELAAAAGQLCSDAGGTVDDAAVRRYHNGRAEVTGFTVAEKAMTGDRAGAVEALRWALQIGVAHVLIADALADAVRTVARVRGSGREDPYALARRLGLPPWKVKKASAQARGWDGAGLAAAIQVVATLNADVKGAAADGEFALERAVQALCAARSGQARPAAAGR